MPLVKCPRCELNYMESSERYCKVCQRELHGKDSRDEPELCSVCNEASALPGKDVCIFCQKEMMDSLEEGEEAGTDADAGPGASLDELDGGIKDELTEPEYPELGGDLSLEEMEEKEEQEDLDEDGDG